MAVKLNNRAYEHATNLIKEGNSVFDERDDWSEHAPTTDEENAFIDEHDINEFGRWHLGIDDEEDEDNKGRYKFPFGDFKKVHRGGVLAAESRAAQNDYYDIQIATAHLHGLIDGYHAAKKG